MAGVIEEANDLLRAIDYLMVADPAGIGESHRAALGVFSDVLDTDQKILHFARLLPDRLRKDNFEPVWVGSLRSADDRHIRSVGTTTGDNLIAGKNERVAQHFHQLLMSQR